MKRILILSTLLTCLVSVSFAQSKDEKAKGEITDLMQKLADAALKSDSGVAEKFYADEMILTSQSGKTYTKKDALLDVKNSFEVYRNDDLKFIHLNKKSLIVNYQNTRQRKTLDEAKFRVTAVWVKKKDSWKIISLQSSKIVSQGL